MGFSLCTEEQGGYIVVIRLSKIMLIMAVAFFASLVVLGNVTNYQTNFKFVYHVLRMDTIFPDAHIKYRQISSPMLIHGSYILIILLELTTALLCWIGAFLLFKNIKRSSSVFNHKKCFAITGLTMGFLVWQVGFMSIGGEWFGMWMSHQWNGVPDAFRFFITICLVLIYVSLPDHDLDD